MANEDLFTNIYSQVHGWCLLAQAELSHYALAPVPRGRPAVILLTTETTPSIALCLPLFLSTLPPVWITGQVQTKQKQKHGTTQLLELLHHTDAESLSAVKGCLMLLRIADLRYTNQTCASSNNSGGDTLPLKRSTQEGGSAVLRKLSGCNASLNEHTGTHSTACSPRFDL